MQKLNDKKVKLKALILKCSIYSFQLIVQIYMPNHYSLAIYGHKYLKDLLRNSTLSNHSKRPYNMVAQNKIKNKYKFEYHL